MRLPAVPVTDVEQSVSPELSGPCLKEASVSSTTMYIQQEHERVGEISLGAGSQELYKELLGEVLGQPPPCLLAPSPTLPA